LSNEKIKQFFENSIKVIFSSVQMVKELLF